MSREVVVINQPYEFHVRLSLIPVRLVGRHFHSVTQHQPQVGLMQLATRLLQPLTTTSSYTHIVSSSVARKMVIDVKKCHKVTDTKWVWRHADAVCFDVDSTVCQDEAIDELAEFCGVGEKVAEV